MSIKCRIKDRVRWSDIDKAGLIRWDAYSRHVEIAETELFREMGMPFSILYDSLDIFLPRVQFHVDYRSPVRLDDMVETEMWVGRLGRSSIQFDFTVRKPDAILAAEGRMVIVTIGRSGGTPVEVPQALQRALAPYIVKPIAE